MGIYAKVFRYILAHFNQLKRSSDMGKLIVEGVDLTPFLGIPYVASRHPGNVSVEEFLANPQLGANCQLFALGVLRKGGFYIDGQLPMDQEERFGSKELWLDTTHTKRVVGGLGLFRPEDLFRLFLDGETRFWDIYFFLPPCLGELDTDENLFKKLHVAVFIGFDFIGRGTSEDQNKGFLHNAKPGPSVPWSLRDFHDRNYSLFGVKRPLLRKK